MGSSPPAPANNKSQGKAPWLLLLARDRGLEVGAVLNDSLNGCQIRERPRRAGRAASHSPPAPAKNRQVSTEACRFYFFTITSSLFTKNFCRFLASNRY